MPKLVIEGIQPYDGTYDLDTSYFTNRELHTIKRLAGVRAGEVSEALDANDTDVVVAIAIIGLTRAGQSPVEDMIWDAKAGSIKLVSEDEQNPPAEAGAPTGE